MGIYSTLIIGRDALITQQRAIEVTGHNIANVNTPGYSRQRLLFDAKDSVDIGIGQIGTGVQGLAIERIYDNYLGDQINNAAQDLGRWEAQRDALERVEMVFDEGSGYGLNNAMSEFWNLWQDLANNPAGHTERTLLLAKSENLTNTFNTIYSDLVGIQNDLDSGISAIVSEINLLAKEIEDLNDKILLIEATNQNANDYRDERDQLLKNISELIDFTSSEASDGRVTITLGDGNDLVGNPAYGTLIATDSDGDGFLDVEWSSASGTMINANISKGKLKGLFETRDVIIDDMLTRLNTLAASIRDEVNAEHIAGYGLDGTQNNFFDPAGTLTDATFSVNPSISANVNKIAAGDTSAAGDNRTALDIATLQNTFTMSTNTSTFDDYYSSLVSDVGIEVREASQKYEHQNSMAAQLDNYRESISGVSLDEEMVNLIRFQHAYNAAAKLITIVDELLETLIRSV